MTSSLWQDDENDNNKKNGALLLTWSSNLGSVRVSGRDGRRWRHCGRAVMVTLRCHVSAYCRGGAIMFDVNRRFNMSQWQLCFDRAVGDKIELLVIWQRWVMITAMNYVSIAGGLTFWLSSALWCRWLAVDQCSGSKLNPSIRFNGSVGWRRLQRHSVAISIRCDSWPIFFVFVLLFVNRLITRMFAISGTTPSSGR